MYVENSISLKPISLCMIPLECQGLGTEVLEKEDGWERKEGSEADQEERMKE